MSTTPRAKSSSVRESFTAGNRSKTTSKNTTVSRMKIISRLNQREDVLEGTARVGSGVDFARG